MRSIVAIVLKMELEEAGHEICKIVSTGEEAIEYVKKENPEVVLMDIRLAGPMDGIKTAKLITTFSKCKIIFTTGYSDPKIREKATLVNHDGYLEKPVEADDIIKLLDT